MNHQHSNFIAEESGKREKITSLHCYIVTWLHQQRLDSMNAELKKLLKYRKNMEDMKTETPKLFATKLE